MFFASCHPSGSNEIPTTIVSLASRAHAHLNKILAHVGHYSGIWYLYNYSTTFHYTIGDVIPYGSQLESIRPLLMIFTFLRPASRSAGWGQGYSLSIVTKIMWLKNFMQPGGEQKHNSSKQGPSVCARWNKPVHTCGQDSCTSWHRLKLASSPSHSHVFNVSRVWEWSGLGCYTYMYVTLKAWE